MTDKEILEKVIEKAVEGGWDDHEWDCDILFFDADDLSCTKWHGEAYCVDIDYKNNIYPLIFDKNFAKAFFGEQLIEHEEHYKLPEDIGLQHSCAPKSLWQYHLQQLVLEEEPLLYLKTFL